MTKPLIRIAFLPDADPDIALPSYQTAGAAGADIRANLTADERETGVTLAPGERRLIPSGLRLEIPQGFEVQIRPRSGLALKHGVTLANAPGTIDSDYRGPLGVILINLGQQAYKVVHGERIAQMVVAPVAQCGFELTAQISQTTRGEGGFGSTGRS